MQNLNVVIVEDDFPVRRSLERLLCAKGFTVKVFEDSESLLDESSDISPDRFLIDYQLPGINGTELINCLRKFGFQQPIVLISGNLEPSFDLESDEMKGVTFLRKPCGSHVLCEALERGDK